MSAPTIIMRRRPKRCVWRVVGSLWECHCPRGRRFIDRAH